MWKTCHLVEAVKPFKLHLTSISYIYKVVEHIQLVMWIGIWPLTHTDILPQKSPQIWESWLKPETIGDVSVQIMSLHLHYDWVCWTFKRAFLIHVIYIWGVWAVFFLWTMIIWIHTHTITTTNSPPDLGELAGILGNVRLQNMPLSYGWGCKTFLNCILHPFDTYASYLSTFNGCELAYGYSLTPLPPP